MSTRTAKTLNAQKREEPDCPVIDDGLECRDGSPNQSHACTCEAPLLEQCPSVQKLRLPIRGVVRCSLTRAAQEHLGYDNIAVQTP